MKIDGRAEVRVRVQPLGAPPVRHVPHAQRFIVAGRQEKLSARMPRQSADPVIVTEQSKKADPC